MPVLQSVGVICVTLPLMSLASSGGSEELVGDFGDFSRLQLQGLERLDPEEVRKGLQLDFELCLAAHPLAKLDVLPAAVQAGLW